jgi:hypothetical protein
MYTCIRTYTHTYRIYSLFLGLLQRFKIAIYICIHIHIHACMQDLVHYFLGLRKGSKQPYTYIHMHTCMHAGSCSLFLGLMERLKTTKCGTAAKWQWVPHVHTTVIHVNIYIYIYIYTFIYAHTHVSKIIRKSIFGTAAKWQWVLYVYTSVIYVCACVCIYMYIYISTFWAAKWQWVFYVYINVYIYAKMPYETVFYAYTSFIHVYYICPKISGNQHVTQKQNATKCFCIRSVMHARIFLHVYDFYACVHVCFCICTFRIFRRNR